MAIAAGTRLGRYEIRSQIAAGGMGEVYLAKDTKLERTVALKVLPADLASDEERMRRFIQEARATAALNHPNIAHIYDIGEAEGTKFMTMEFIDGDTLRAKIHRDKSELRKSLEYLMQVARGLAKAHEAGIVHRDLKPDNIMITGDGFAKILDFGLAKLIEPPQASAGGGGINETATMLITAQHSTPGMILGTLGYMSPEQARGDVNKVDHRSDIFSFGCLLHEAATMHRPFEGTSAIDTLHKIVYEPAPPIRDFNPVAPRSLQRIVRRCLAKEPEQRFQAIRDVAVELEDLLHEMDRGLGASHSTSRSTPDRWTVSITERITAPLTNEPRVAQSEPKPSVESSLKETGRNTEALRVALLYKRNTQPDEHVLGLLQEELTKHGHKVFIDHHLGIDVEWAKEIERQMCTSDVVVPLISATSSTSEMLGYEVQIAHEAAQQQKGKPRIFPVRINFEGALPEPLGSILGPLHSYVWSSPRDDSALVTGLVNSLHTPRAHEAVEAYEIKQTSGAVPLDSQFYILRETDKDFLQAIKRRDSIVLVKGARQMGKTSLLARGIQQARLAGAAVVLTDFQKLNAAHLESIENFFLALSEMIYDQLDVDTEPEDAWSPRRGPSINFERYIRRVVLKQIGGPLVWAMDEVDRLLTCQFGSEVFGLFRSWHNERSLDPTSPWEQLTLAIVYATEPHLFITDLNQSPFNVGTKLELRDFTVEQVAELNERYGSPLKDQTEVSRFYLLVGGHPYLVHSGIVEIKKRGLSLSAFEALADQDEGPFGDHLRRILVLLARDPGLTEVVREVLRGHSCPTTDSFYRLHSTGLVSGHSAREAKLHCPLYANYLERHLI
jgi:serine/threonine protein kinase